jgi:uncharacterized protein with HEPN domain
MSNHSQNSRIVELFLFDIFVAIYKIQDILKDFKSAQELLFSYRDWDSVIREFEIIGEASKHLLKANLIKNDYQVIVDFRNKIAHGYFGIDESVVWSIAHSDLKDFLQTIRSLILDIEPVLKQELLLAFEEDNKYLDFIVDALKGLENG